MSGYTPGSAVHAIHLHSRNRFGDFVVKSTRESDVLFSNTLLPQQFGVSDGGV